MQKKSRNILKLFSAILVLSLLFIAACSSTETSPAAPASSDDETPVSANMPVPGSEVKEAVVVPSVDQTNSKTQDEIKQESTASSAESSSAVKEITMSAKAWAFEPDTIEVSKGDRVKVTVTATDVKHGISIWGINKRLEPNKSEVIEFTADEVGEFPFFCTVYCGDGHSSMKGKVVVR